MLGRELPFEGLGCGDHEDSLLGSGDRPHGARTSKSASGNSDIANRPPASENDKSLAIGGSKADHGARDVDNGESKSYEDLPMYS